MPPCCSCVMRHVPPYCCRYMNDQRYLVALGVLLGVDLKVAPGECPISFSSSTLLSLTHSQKTRMIHLCRSPQQPRSRQLHHLNPWRKKLVRVRERRRYARTQHARVTLTLAQALGEKDKGNAAYKKKDFTAALEHYDRAIELDPDNITFLTNKAGESIHTSLSDKGGSY